MRPIALATMTVLVVAVTVTACDIISDRAATPTEGTSATPSATLSPEELLRDSARRLGPDPAVLEASSLTLCSYGEARPTVSRVYCDQSGHRIVSISVSLPIEVLDPDAELIQLPIPDEYERLLLGDGTTAYFLDEFMELDNEATGEVGTGLFDRRTSLWWDSTSGFFIRLTSERIFEVHEPWGRDELLAFANSVAGGRPLEGIGSEG